MGLYIKPLSKMTKSTSFMIKVKVGGLVVSTVAFYAGDQCPVVRFPDQPIQEKWLGAVAYALCNLPWST